MAERMLHFVHGPWDDDTAMLDSDEYPFMVQVPTDTDGYYWLDYSVAGQWLGELRLTRDDVLARWHQRTSPHDFQTGDTVIVKATAAQAMVIVPASIVDKNGNTEERWLISIDSRQRLVSPDEIRIARADELSHDDGLSEE